MGYDLSRPTHSYSRKFQKPIMCPCFNHKAICVYIRRHIAVDGALLPPYLMVSSCLYKFGQGMYLCCIINVKCPNKQGHTQYVCACSGCDHRSYWTFFWANFNLASLNESGQRGTPRCFAISCSRYVIWDLSLNSLFQFIPSMPRRILI